MAFIAGLVAWFVAAYVLRFIMGFEEWGPWIGMAVGVFVYGFIDGKKKKPSEETENEGN